MVLLINIFFKILNVLHLKEFKNFRKNVLKYFQKDQAYIIFVVLICVNLTINNGCPCNAPFAPEI